MTPLHPPMATDGSPLLSSQPQGWDNIRVELFQHPAGEGHCQFNDEHTLCLSLSPRPVRLLQVRDGKTHSGLYAKGDLLLTPAEMPFFARWDSDDHYLQLRIASRLLQRIAREDLEVKGDRLELVSEFQTRDPQLEAIAMMFLTELQRGTLGNNLYIDSLTNVLAVHLIRHYLTTPSPRPIYEGGLPQRQVLQVLDYIQAHLDQEIKLVDLATLLGMSPFHFSRQFKQALGITPYQYLLQQRIERAKQWLKQSDRPITDIALLCGFNSHSHLSKQFRHVTGMTPNTYRRHE